MAQKATDQQKRPRGRPATGETPARCVRIGAEWDEARRLAKLSGTPFARYVEQALKEKNECVRDTGEQRQGAYLESIT